eukprot:scaffold597_cov146-Skeletonema_marinoi.AAC.1
MSIVHGPLEAVDLHIDSFTGQYTEAKEVPSILLLIMTLSLKQEATSPLSLFHVARLCAVYVLNVFEDAFNVNTKTSFGCSTTSFL